VRLLDRIAQTRTPLLVACGSQIVRLPSAADYASTVSTCPLRLVLTEALTRVCASLAYAEGDRLAGCLDLIHFPATRLWVEWPDRPRREAVAAALGLPFPDDAESNGLAGIYLTTDASGRRGTVRTFWGAPDGTSDPSLAPLVTDFDLDAEPRSADPIDAVFRGASARVRSDDVALETLLDSLRFRFDAAWAAYYRTEFPSPSARETVLRASLATVGTDLPVLFALCLLLSSRMRLPERRPDISRLNRRRAREGRPALLDHVVMTVPVLSAYSVEPRHEGDPRRMPRLHHVRGHLVRRGSQVFWRVPHLRGRAAFGHLRARNVTIRFEPRGPIPRAGWSSDAHPAASSRELASSAPGG